MTDLADFAPDEIDRIRTIVIELRKSERSRQKTLRAELRGMGFRISDYRQSGAPFTVVDFDELVARVRSGRRSETHPLAQASAPAPRRAPMPHGDEPALALSAARAVGTANAVETVPRSPGLYAVHGDEAVWRELGLGPPPDSRPLYVGKSEHDLRSRDVRTHFRTGRTAARHSDVRWVRCSTNRSVSTPFLATQPGPNGSRTTVLPHQETLGSPNGWAKTSASRSGSRRPALRSPTSRTRSSAVGSRRSTSGESVRVGRHSSSRPGRAWPTRHAVQSPSRSGSAMPVGRWIRRTVHLSAGVV